ncbi:tetratricopeptide repeat-containing diguanylate cyclase [Shewanella sp. HN-41]|uniref:tetratricopeptide repeat-containing diguanylate cyclase n=1 Tax=Shewanella sp. HN-41 TaxID=327275 RepID=UPI00021259FD|nr:GGDEF domain-containing protein [Shewanella sp. HN-41]EGM71055.1 GGDEF family protein [Shewanella sp. HN-41]
MAKFIAVIIASIMLAMPFGVFASTSTESAVDAEQSYYQILSEADGLRSSDPQRFSQLLTEVREQQAKLNQQELDYLAYLSAYELSFSGKFTEAVAAYQALINSHADPELTLRARLSVVNIYAFSQNWNGGLTQLAQILPELPRVSDPQLKTNGWAIAAVFYNGLGQYPLGLEYSQQLKNTATDPRSQCMAVQLEVESKFRLHSIAASSPDFDEAIAVCEGNNELVMASIIRSNRAEQYLSEGNSEKALSVLESNLAAVESSGYAPIKASYYSLLADAYLNQGQLDAAKSYAEIVSSNKVISTNNITNARANRVLYEIYRQQGDTAAALEAYIRFAEADKAYLDEVKTKNLAFQLAEHQSIEQQNRISLLDEQNKLLTVQQQLDQAETFNNRLLIAVLFSVILGLVTWGYHSFKNQKRLKQLAEYDSLTGLFSRGHFTQVSRSAMKHTETLGAPVSCILFDLDRFKRINDIMGHKTGDWALKLAATVCQEQVRDYDIVGRIGGEEFCVLLPECVAQDAELVAQSVREALANRDTSESGHSFKLTASFGVSDTLSSGYCLEQLAANADKAMYRAKNTGRNQVCVFDSELDK